MSDIAADHFLRHTATLDGRVVVDTASRRIAASVRTELLTLRDMLADIDHWRTLSAQVIEANVFHDPAFQAAALLHLPEAVTPRFLVLRLGANGEWIGALCLSRHGFELGLPAWRNWNSRYSSLGAPLIHKDHVLLAITAIEDWLARGGEAAHLILCGLRADGPILDGFRSSRSTGVVTLVHSARAVLAPQAANGSAAQAWYSGKRRSKLKRLRARLSAEGAVTFIDAAERLGANASIEAFLALEATGWKGAQGSALVLEPGRAAFARSGLRALAAEGRLKVLALFVGGEPAAIGLLLLHGGCGFLWKLAVSEEHIAAAPGVLFIQSLTEWAAAQELDFIDSCAAPGDQMIEAMWPDRIKLCDVLITARPGSLPARLLAYRERGKRQLRNWLKSKLHRWRKGR